MSIADAINQNLDYHFEVTIWRNGTFELSNNAIDDLINKASSVDFSIFIFSPDDLITIRKEETKVARDNVVFELGLFIGQIGKERCFIVKPRNIELHLPTDLLGLNTTDYDSNRSDGDLASSLNFACTKIKTSTERLGLISTTTKYTIARTEIPIINSDLSDFDFKFLSLLLQTESNSPTGISLWLIRNDLKTKDRDVRVDLCAIKLIKLGLIEKENAVDQNGEDYYAYKITQDGLHYLLKNEKRLNSIFEPVSSDPDELPF